MGGFFVFVYLLLPKSPYTQQQPADWGTAAVLLLAGLGGCRLVEEQTTSSPEL
jgi:hypothetical protein